MTGLTPWGTSLVTEVSSSPPNADFPTWVDISDYVIGRAESYVGRQTQLDATQPGSFSLLLNNNDARFVVGNTGSPYYPWFKQGRRMRMREIIAGRPFTLFDGYIQIPENLIDFELADGSAANMTTAVTGVDLLGWLQGHGKFISTLAEQIRYVGASAGLKAYYPMNDATTPFLDVSGNNYPAILATVNQGSSLPGTPSGTAAILPATTKMAPGDDVSVAAVTMQTVGTQDNGDVTLTLDLASASKTIPILSGQTLTIAAWFNADPSAACTQIAVLLNATLTQSGSAFALFDVEYDASAATHSGSWYMHFQANPELVATRAIGNHWVPIALRYSWSPQTYELWFADQPAQTGTWAGAPPTDLSLAKLLVSSVAYAGALGHLQIYVGDPAAFTHAMWLDQISTGWLGMERQLSGDRVRTIAAYAGVPTGRMDIDPGVEMLQKVTLAGRDPLSVLLEAVDTERGRLFAQDGRLVFHDRRRVFNV